MTVPSNYAEAMALLTAALPENPISGFDVREVVTWLHNRILLCEFLPRAFSAAIDMTGVSYYQIATGSGTLTLTAAAVGLRPGCKVYTFIPGGLFTVFNRPNRMYGETWDPAVDYIVELEAVADDNYSAFSFHVPPLA